MRREARNITHNTAYHKRIFYYLLLKYKHYNFITIIDISENEERLDLL